MQLGLSLVRTGKLRERADMGLMPHRVPLRKCHYYPEAPGTPCRSCAIFSVAQKPLFPCRAPALPSPSCTAFSSHTSLPCCTWREEMGS